MTRTFYICKHVWFVLHYTGGKLDALEEHDFHEGGFIPSSGDLSWEEYFVQAARQRAHGDDWQNRVETAAREFLVSSEKARNIC